MQTPSPLARALVLALVPLAASATIIKAETIEEMSAHAPTIVRGTVRSAQAMRTEDHRGIDTWAEIQVTEVLKGTAGAVVLVKQPGGAVGPVATRPAGVAHFEPGQDCLLFLEPAVGEPGTLFVYGLAAGKVDFVTEQGATVAVRNLEGLAFASPAGKVTSVRPVGDGARLGTKAAFLERVRAAVKGGAR